jgi:site-specific DNA recombinase
MKLEEEGTLREDLLDFLGGKLIRLFARLENRGPDPQRFDVDRAGRRLVVNEKEAQRVREIFALYSQHPSLAIVVSELERRKWKTKSWTSKSGISHAGRPFTTASLCRLLTNAVYAGKVEHRGTIYPGEHTAIVDPSAWEKVNAKLRANRGQLRANYTKQDPLLADLLVCTSCQRPMVATYTSKKGRRYRYYVCRAVRQNGWNSCSTKSVPAQLIEDSVVTQLRTALTESREQLQIPEIELQKLREGGSAGLVRSLVQQIGYDGATGAVSLKLRRIDHAD